MAPRTLILAASALVGVACVAAQSAPNWIYFPTACASECASTIESAYTCETQFSGDTTSTYSCFCNNYPTDVATCSTCLNSNNAAALASLLTSTQTACPQAIKSCFFACSFDTCDSTDVACQCDATYLENIYNCGSCNTANGNTGATQLSDFQSLQDSCKNQNYTAASSSFTTKALPVANTANYVAPTLTATGGGVAATGAATGSGGLAAAGTGSSPSGGSSSGTTSKAASGASASGGGVAAASASNKSVASAASGASSASGATTSHGAASGLVAPAFGGVIAVVGAVAALI